MNYTKQIRETRPIVHCITNPVTVNDCANIVLAMGASVTMAHHKEEVEEITTGCNALVCNFGATDDFESIFLAVKRSNECHHPVIVDPVGISGSTFRRKKLIELLETAHITCIRGNYSEIKALLQDESGISGVDAAEEDQQEEDSLFEQMKVYALKKKVILVASGKIDLVTDGKKSYALSGGNEIMSRITGTGCMSSTMLGAILAVDPSVEAVAWSCSYMKKTGELAYEQTQKVQGGTMTFKEKLIDTISLDQL